MFELVRERCLQDLGRHVYIESEKIRHCQRFLVAGPEKRVEPEKGGQTVEAIDFLRAVVRFVPVKPSLLVFGFEQNQESLPSCRHSEDDSEGEFIRCLLGDEPHRPSLRNVEKQCQEEEPIE